MSTGASVGAAAPGSEGGNSGENSSSGGRRRGGRGRYNSRGSGGRGSNGGAGPRNPTSGQFAATFAGREPTLKGHVYDLSNEKNSEQFAQTTKEVMNWVGREYTKHTGELVKAVQDLSLTPPPALADPQGGDPVAFEVWKHELKKYSDRLETQAHFRARLFTVVLGQCTEALEDRLKSLSGWSAAQQDGIALLLLIKTITYTFEEKKYLPEALMEMKEEFYLMRQGPNEPLQRYYERFKNQVSVMKEVNISIVDEGLLDSVSTASGNRGNPDDADKLKAYNLCLAVRFLRGANKKCGKYLTELRNSFLNKNDDYPKNLSDAYNIMQRRSEFNGTAVEPDGSNSGIAFVTAGRGGTQGANPRQLLAGLDGRSFGHITCHSCQEVGHYSDQCPSNRTDANEGEQQGIVAFVSKRVVPKSWVLLDSEANVDLFHNKALLRNIRRVNSSMTVHCNAGTRVTRLQGDLPGYPFPVWYCAQAIANVLSLSNVSSIYRWRVDYSSADGNEFVVTKEDGSEMVFTHAESDNKDGPSGLYYYDMNVDRSEGTLLVSTVMENKNKYTLDERNRADAARSLQIKIGHPSTRDFIRLVTHNHLPNCPVTKADIVNAEDIYGPALGALKGKTTRRPTTRVQLERSMLPRGVMERHKDVTVCADIMFVNSIPFLISVSRGLKFGTVQEMSGRSADAILKAFDNVRSVYRGGGFRVRHALMDGEFKTLKDKLADRKVLLNATSRDEHVGEIERYIRTIKERVRCVYNTLPFERWPPRMVIELVKHAVFWRNAFPCKNGISNMMSPRMIVTGSGLDYNRHCKHEFGQYVQTHEEHDNSMRPRTIGAIALRPTGNNQGSHYYFSLSSGRIINRSYATALPMPSEVIDRVHTLARRQKANKGIIFGGRDGTPDVDEPGDAEYNDDDDDDDSDYTPEPYDEEDFDDEWDDNDDPPAADEAEDAADNALPDDAEDGLSDVDEGEEPDEVDIDAEEDDDPPQVEELAGDEPEGNAEVNDGQLGGNTEVDHDENSQEDLVQQMDARYGPRSGAYGLRPRRKSKTYMQALMAEATKPAEIHETTATSQMSLRKGLRVFGEKGAEAVKKEMQQLHDRKVMRPRNAKSLTSAQRKEALGYLMFLKRKRDGSIKGRGCADGRKQRSYISKEDSTSPTVSTEAVFLTAVVDALEKRSVAVVDVPGAFMQVDMDEDVVVRFEGTMVDKLIEIDPEMYLPHVVYEHGKKVIYVDLLKALYGTLRAARLFWEKLSGVLTEWGFTPNPYDPCVMNKIVNKKQITVAWHVDDLKISHVDGKVVVTFVDKMEETFGKEAPLTKSFGPVHNYLGMKLDFSKPGELTVTMIDYIKTIIAEMPEDMVGSAATPAASHLFDVNEDTAKLDGAKAEAFYRIVMQLQYLSQRARPDLRTAVSFLCKRVTKSDEDDYKKLTRVMRNLQSTVDLPLTLKADGSGNLYWWVDASFGVHPDMKGHTGGTFSMGKGSIYSTSSAQKLVGRSSTEDELIGVHDVLPQMLWTRYFLREQGFAVEKTILYQDNMSAMLLEKNGRGSSTKRTRHIKLRYYYVKQHVDNGDIEIVHCPTGIMWGDYFTKPLQGSPFYLQRDAIMNIDPSSRYHSSNRSVLKNGNGGQTGDTPDGGRTVRFTPLLE